MRNRRVPIGLITTFTLVAMLAVSVSSQARVFPLPNRPQALSPPRHDIGDRSEVKPWFHGWYTRITDRDGSGSIAVIGASQDLPDESTGRGDGALPGYLAIIIEQDGAIEIHESFPERTYVETNRPFTQESGDFADWTENWSEFEWSADGYGHISNESIRVSIPGGVQVTAELARPHRWNDRIPWLGPEGVVEFFQFVPLHWLVYSLGSYAHYTLERAEERGGTTEHTGIAHQEANWGEIFPPAWIWAQAVSPDNSRQIALAGGELAFERATLTTWLAAFHSPTIAWEFRPTIPGTRYTTTMAPCEGTFRLSASDFARALEIEAAAPASSFVDLSIPTAEGFRRGAAESFAATIHAEAFVRVSKDEVRLIDQFRFTGAALEFGGAYRCDDSSARHQDSIE
jgi:hypothetical protein